MVGLRHDVLAAEVDAMVDETAALAAIDSGSHDPVGVDRVAGGMASLLADRGFHIARTPLAGHGHQVTARMELGDGPTVVLLGHADTVWERGWPVRREGDMLYGPGVGDMKGCVVMAAHAIGAARRHGLDGLGAIEVLVVPDEELGSPGSRAWIEERVRGAAACLGLEAGWPGGGVVVARGAVGALQVLAHGRAAHCAGHEDEGASALTAIAPLVAALQAHARPEAGVRVTAGILRAGTARQVVPGEAELHVDLRAPDAAAADALLSALRAEVEAVHEPGVDVELLGGFTRPAFEADRSTSLWALAQRRAAELGIPVHAVRTRGGSDASFAAALGVPTLDGLGPICHDSCAPGERIEIASLASRGALLAALLIDLAAQAREPASGNVDAPA
jgi:glutamate carboxypeptidase